MFWKQSAPSEIRCGHGERCYVGIWDLMTTKMVRCKCGRSHFFFNVMITWLLLLLFFIICEKQVAQTTMFHLLTNVNVNLLFIFFVFLSVETLVVQILPITSCYLSYRVDPGYQLVFFVFCVCLRSTSMIYIMEFQYMVVTTWDLEFLEASILFVTWKKVRERERLHFYTLL